MSVLERLRAGTIVASLVSFPFILPHVVEDFAEGITGRVGLPTGPGAFLLGGFLALQSLGLVLVGRGGRGGFVVTFWVAVIWVAGALVDHGPALLAGRFRGGSTSVLWVMGLLFTQTASLALASWGWRRSRAASR
ncbi:MAG TPA: hypothetical protein VEO73_07375 [Gemmatimonadales bacterium]|nr:hypothetical protein [Gemmatimonadales bacterium]